MNYMIAMTAQICKSWYLLVGDIRCLGATCKSICSIQIQWKRSFSIGYDFYFDKLETDSTNDGVSHLCQLYRPRRNVEAIA
jgi:hypothetical protein